eukprot:TRINITY_DN5008_c0_g1_i1.p1 TRINITY_DN5008_c0_g1~~TRINITY_DN5008_c0_g1_i1.p1  ORF type:complete len:595 (-),score=155.49 TRINITY_DN5008_c0_g1_i1:888-2594(-)
MDETEKSILWIIGIDGSEEAHGAFKQAVRLNSKHSTFLLCSFVRPKEKDTQREKAASVLETYVSMALQYSIPSRVYIGESKDIGEDLCKLVEKELAQQNEHSQDENSTRSSYLVIGSRGQGKAQGILLGSVSSYVIRHARCPVLVVNRASILQSSDRSLQSLVPAATLNRFNNFSLNPSLQEREKLFTGQLSPLQEYSFHGRWNLATSSPQFIAELVSNSELSPFNTLVEPLSPYTSSYTLTTLTSPTSRPLSPLSRLQRSGYHHEERSPTPSVTSTRSDSPSVSPNPSSPPQQIAPSPSGGQSPPRSPARSPTHSPPHSPARSPHQSPTSSAPSLPRTITLGSSLPLCLGGSVDGDPRPLDWFLCGLTSSLISNYVSRLSEDLISLQSLRVRTELHCDHAYSLGLYSHDNFLSSLSITIKLLTTDNRSSKPLYSHIPTTLSSSSTSVSPPRSRPASLVASHSDHPATTPSSTSHRSTSPPHVASPPRARTIRNSLPPSTSYSSLITKNHLLELFDDAYHRTPELWVLRNHPDLKHLLTISPPTAPATSSPSGGFLFSLSTSDSPYRT